MKQLDLIGQKFDRLKVTRKVDGHRKNKTCWECLCDCGGVVIVVGSKLKNKHTRSCGCIKIERLNKIRPAKKPPQPCPIEGCGRVKKGMYCDTHKARLKRTGTLDIFRRPNGKGNIGNNGYVDLCIKGRRVYEHVLVAEKALGKRLPPGAVVHHINKNRQDNRNCNLVICQDQAYHLGLHKRENDLQ